jgi:LDH2 family malate/lactate/ureidoglycolate dehydrogenase
MPDRYRYKDLIQFSTDLFIATGLAPERAQVMASIFVEADLLGFTTHGMNRIAINLSWLEKGESRLSGEPEVIVDRGNLFNWDANFLPGPWVVSQAIDQCIERVATRGIVTATIRRSQHIACLGAYCPKIAEAGYVALITCSTPTEHSVSPHGGIDPVFSANPIAFVAPADGYPILFDISMCITAGGYVSRAHRAGEKMAGKYLKDNQGDITDDPATFFTDPPGSILPIGGLSHGYKGYALTMLTELLSMSLGGYGRASDSSNDGEANSVFIQIIDPQAFGSLAEFKQQTNAIKFLCENSRNKDGEPAVRVPGQRAWQSRHHQLENGLTLYPTIMEDLALWAKRLNVELPLPFTGIEPVT